MRSLRSGGLIDVVDEGITFGGVTVLSLKDLLTLIVALALEKMVGADVVTAFFEKNAEVGSALLDIF